jgi:hypothetical protein
MYLRIIDGDITYPYTIRDLRMDNPNTSFPQIIEDEYLGNFDMYIVYPTTKPNDYTKNIREGIPQLIDGKYYQNWILENAIDEDIANRIEFKWGEIRMLRNELLSECDWTVLSDSPISGEKLEDWKHYRHELRNITEQENPFFIVWPTKPL